MEEPKNTKVDNEEPLSVEMEGKTPAEAIATALKILKISRKEVKVKILSEEEKGLFGMDGARPAKVRVTVIKNKKLDKTKPAQDN